MTEKELLAAQLKICLIHSSRLKLAISKIESIYPFSAYVIENLNEVNLAYLELLTTRLGKLQDYLGEKIFNSLLETLGEAIDHKSFIDKLNKLEELEVITSVKWWMDLRTLRNILVHEYPDSPDFIADNLNKAFVQAKRLIEFLESLIAYIQTNVFKQ